MSKFKKSIEELEEYSKKILEEVNLSDNFLFAKTMEDEEVCKKVLEEILPIKINKIRISSMEKSLKTSFLSKGIRLDVYAQDDNNTVYNVEMQTSNNPNLGKRSRYYQGIIDSSLIQKGEGYEKLNKTYIIFICTFPIFDGYRHKYTFKNICMEDKTIELPDESIKLFLGTEGIIDDISDNLKGFLEYLKCSTEEVAQKYNNPLVETVAKRVKEVKENPRLRREFMTLEMLIKEKADAAKAEGRAEGMELAEIKMIKTCLSMYGEEMASKISGRSIEEIRKIKESK